ncbi:MAG TPA: SDR family NAD(P)-dependent oxidoreductase [Segetibacter sp.]|nr:SDR family NAD(P)-dependent oxidoreductase [Segetibacter sp.]
MKTVLVIGATGMIGRIVSSQLLEDGYRVVAMVRNPSKAGNELKKGIELIRGDVTSYNDVLQACRNADFIHISTSGGNNQENIMAVEYEGTLNVLQAAIEMRIKHITMISGMHVNKDSLDYPAEKAKYLAENAIKSSSTPYTIFKPTFFMETLERHIQGNKAVIIGKQPKALNMIAAKDLAKNISKTYQMNAAINQVFFPKGKEAIKLKNAWSNMCQKNIRE